MIEPFFLRALIAGLALAVIAAPLGCVVVWSRMAYFGETIAQACLIGVAISLAFSIDMTVGTLGIAVLAALAILVLSRQDVLPLDSVLALMHHGALSAGIIAVAMLAGPAVDLMGFLFGEIFAVSTTDLAWIAGSGVIVLLTMWRLWQPLLRTAVHPELAAAEGVDTRGARTAYTLLLAVFIAVAIKIFGILLVIAFLIVPAVAARPFADTPEHMVLLSGVIAAAGVVAGLSMSWTFDAPGGPAIVLVLALAAALSLLRAGLGTR